MSTIETIAPAPKSSRCDVWDERGELVPLTPAPAVEHEADVAAIVVSRNRPDLVDGMVRQLQDTGRHLTMDIYVVEMGTDADKLSTHCSLRYDDPDFRGKCYGHNVGLRLARARGRYRYYWILMNDLIFEEGPDVIQELVDVADANPTIAILSMTASLRRVCTTTCTRRAASPPTSCFPPDAAAMMHLATSVLLAIGLLPRPGSRRAQGWRAPRRMSQTAAQRPRRATQANRPRGTTPREDVKPCRRGRMFFS